MKINKLYGIIPARMSASRFPGKPLHLINGKPMIQHVIERSLKYKKWDKLYVTTCDKEIKKFSESIGCEVIMTSKSHKRALDRVAEAAKIIKSKNNDFVICVQADEPMLKTNMIKAVIDPLIKDQKIKATVLGLNISNKTMFQNKDIVKIIFNSFGKVLYTSRSPIPFVNSTFSEKLDLRRIGGIFGFRYKYLKLFVNQKETRLEKLESCDSNRILDMSFDQYVAKVNVKHSQSVDTIKDLKLVEKLLKNMK